MKPLSLVVHCVVVIRPHRAPQQSARGRPPWPCRRHASKDIWLWGKHKAATHAAAGAEARLDLARLRIVEALNNHFEALRILFDPTNRPLVLLVHVALAPDTIG